jgi:hypothetical protein
VADIMSIVSTAHKSNVLSSPSGSSTYIPADSSLYQGGRTGTYSDGKKIPAQPLAGRRLPRAGPRREHRDVPHRQVPIEDSSFRFGNTKFTLIDVGKAQIKNVVTDPATGATYLDAAVATLDA